MLIIPDSTPLTSRRGPYNCQQCGAPVNGVTYCHVCQSMLEAADTPYLRRMEQEWNKELLRRKQIINGNWGEQ